MPKRASGSKMGCVGVAVGAGVCGFDVTADGDGRAMVPEDELQPTSKIVSVIRRARPFKTCVLLKLRTCAFAARLRAQLETD